MTPRHLLRLAGLVLGLGLTITVASAQSTVPSQATSLSNLGELLDRLPNLSGLGLPGFLPKDVFRIYSSPHFGDLIHKDYMRVPVGIRAKISPDIQAYGELEGYFTHGLAGSAGYGLDRLKAGFRDDVVKAPPGSMDVNWSTGVDFVTPLSRPPMELTDGHRHTVPFVGASMLIAPDWALTGYSTIGVDLLNHTALPANFGRNQLHSNSLTFSTGLTRAWPKFSTLITASYSSTDLLSDEHHQVFGLRPAVVFPLTRWQGRHTRLTATVGGWSIWGPDGHELGASGSVRVEFGYKASDKKH